MSDLLSKIKAKRDERVQDLHLDLPVPTWDGDMYVRLRVIDRDEVEKFANQRRTLESDGNFIVQATKEIYLRDPDHTATGKRHDDNPDYVRLEDDAGDPIRWEKRLAELLGEEEISSARAVLMYCLKDNGIALGGLTLQAITWMQNTDNKVGVSIVGES